MATVLFNSVCKIYPHAKNTPPAVKDFNLEINDKEFIVLVGPSGCGKSTTLRMLAGLESITSGDIYIGDQRINDLPPKERDIAMVFQNYALYPNLNIYENIAFGLRIRRTPKYQIDEKVKGAAKTLEIENLLERFPRHVSGGQKQRVALGRAIVRNPKVFLMDEPLSNLDAKMRVQMRLEIIKLHRALGATTVYVTHDQVEAMTMGDKIVVMQSGVIQQVGTPEEIYNFPANKFVGGFIGSPPMNFINGRILRSDTSCEFCNGRIELTIPPEKAKLLEEGNAGYELIGGIRPENLSMDPDKIKNYPHTTFKGTVEVSELVGADRYVYVSIGDRNPVIVRTSSREKYIDGSMVTVYADMDSFQFFDLNSGKRYI